MDGYAVLALALIVFLFCLVFMVFPFLHVANPTMEAVTSLGISAVLIAFAVIVVVAVLLSRRND